MSNKLKLSIGILLLLIGGKSISQNLGFSQRYFLDSTSSGIEYNIEAYYGSTAFNKEMIQLFRNGGEFTNELKTNVENHLNTINRGGGNIHQSLTYISPKPIYKDIGIYASFQMDQSAGVEFTDDAFTLAFRGNQSFINDTAWLQRTGFHNTGYKSISLGINQFNKLRVGINFLSYGYNNFATVQKGWVATDTTNQELSATVNTNYTQFSTGKSSLWNNRGNGVTLNFEWVLPLNPDKPDQYAVVGIQNFGIQWSTITTTQIDTVYNYSGFELNSFNNLGQSIGGINLQDTLNITTNERKYSSLMPFEIYCYKLPGDKKVSSIYGFRYRVETQSIPLIYAGASIKLGESGSFAPYIAYGNFSKFKLGANLRKNYEHFSLSLNSTNLGGFVSKNSYSQSLNLSFIYKL